jgi:signal transduction histidine kinase
VRAKDGRLWFLTVQGVTIIDPRALHTERAPTPLRIDTVVVNDRTIDTKDGVRLAPGVTRLAIDYAVPDLTSPLRTRFRYRLDGFDKEWVDGGTRRQAIYTNLPPGAYQFNLQAAAEDGSWNRAAIAWGFAVRPAFYQTSWFYVLCTLGLAAMLWGAWQLRLAQVRKQFTLLLGERVRLSREIHDTLLQSLVGVTLQLDQIANDLDGPADTTRNQFVRMRKQVEEYIREARQSIWNLRSSVLDRCDLATALRQTGERAADNAVAFDFSVSGDARRFESTVEEQVLRIGQEAVTNAIRHAQAQRIRMELQYGESDVTLRVSDDGRGFDTAGMGDNKDDHWGVMSMRERAETVGGVFRISSTTGEGTLIETVVPVSSHG